MASRSRLEVAKPTLVSERFGLTRAEWEVLCLLSEGLSNREMARQRCVSVETIRTHVHRTLTKLGMSSRSQAAVFAVRALASAPLDDAEYGEK
jgi:DNA-binding NarL/FixJ family response regulator